MKVVMKSRMMDQLGRDLVYRRRRQWPLVDFCDWIQFKDDAPTDYLEINKRERPDRTLDMNQFREDFRFVQPLLDLFKGNLAIAGGFFTAGRPEYNDDVDFFVHSCDEKRANEIIKESVRYIVMNSDKLITIEHSMHVVNVVETLRADHDIVVHRKYQFILRLYPSLDTILGGFDLGCSMVAYDGDRIMATPLGAYTLVNNRIIIDISRRSTTFSKRLAKYRQRGFSVVFPGFHKDTRFTNNEGTTEALEKIKAIAAQYNLEFRAYSFEYDYHGCTDPPERLSVERAFETSSDIHFMDFKIQEYTPNHSILLPPKPNKSPCELCDYGPAATYHLEESNLSALMNLRDEGVMVKSIASKRTFEAAWEQIFGVVKIQCKMDYQEIDRDECYSLIKETLQENVRRFGVFRDQKYNTPDWLANIEAFRDRRIAEMRPKLIGLQWITQNPGRQWTSSINPALIGARQFYGKFYTPAYVILSPDVETVVRLVLKRLGVVKDIRTLIISWIPFV